LRKWEKDISGDGEMKYVLAEDSPALHKSES
jgi:hypothetical protein